jgi:hypothetical protein
VLFILFAVWQLIEVIGIHREYGPCFKLERKRVRRLPREYRRLNKDTGLAIVASVEVFLKLPTIDRVLLGYRACNGWCVAGQYSRGVLGDTTLCVNGWRRFYISDIAHELAHHVAVSHHNYWGHDERFLAAEELVFDTIEDLIETRVL